jgi:hypothetical protein
MELGRQKMNSQSARVATGKRHAGPNLGIVATVYVLLKIASVFPVSAFGSNPPFFPGLNAPTETVVSYFSRHGTRYSSARSFNWVQQSRSGFSPPPLPAPCSFLA